MSNRIIGAAQIIFILLAWGQMSLASEIPRSSFSIGAWNGAAYISDGTSTFDHCGVAARYNSGISFIISLSADEKTWGIGFVNPNWKLKSGEQYQVGFSIDRIWKTQAYLVASEDNFVTMYTTNREFIGALQAGEYLQINTPTAELKFQLRNTARVVNALEICVSKFTAENTSPSENPFAQRQQPKNPFSTPNSNTNLDAQTLAVTYLNGLIQSGRIGNFRVLKGSEIPQSMRGEALTWTDGDVLGGLYVTGSHVTLDTQQSKLIGDDTASCAKGSFASGAQDTNTGKFSVRRIFTACTDTGIVAITYSMYPLKMGGYYVITNAGSSLEAAQKADDQFFGQLTSP